MIGLALWASWSPARAAALEYAREAVRDGETWRLLTCHLVHWTPRMAAMDLGALLVLGLWLESRRPALLLLTMAAGAASTSAAIHLLSPSVSVYRGASGIDSALFAAAAAEIIFASRSKAAVRLAAAALGIFLAKVSWEAATGTAIAAGPLPSGVRVAPEAHLAGAIAGALSALVLRRAPALSFRHRAAAQPGGDRRGEAAAGK